MCFSTEASFTASAILAAVGCMTMKNIHSRSQFFLACIPFLFALQQFFEGFVWLYLSQHIGNPMLFIAAQKAFLTFAFFIWPIWIPLALAVPEQIIWRRRLLFALLYSGIGLSLLNLSYALQANISVKIIYHSLQYQGHIPQQTLIYPSIVLLPLFLSSLKNVWIFGLLVTFGYVIVDYFYAETFISVWCFFAAVVSLSVYKVLKDNSYILTNKAL